MRTKASAIAINNGTAMNLMISGGSNFGVRYNDQALLSPANFSFSAFAQANHVRKSEAEVIKDVLIKNHGVPYNRIFTETLSSTTEENADFAKIILKRRPMFTGNEKIGILTLLYHMEKAYPIFLRQMECEPLFAENLLAKDDPVWIEKICEYYATPKGGKQYDVNRIYQLLTEGNNLEEMLS